MMNSLCKIATFSSLCFTLGKKKYIHADGPNWSHNWDSRLGAECKYKREIFLIPHGESEHSPNPNPYLSALGKRQAERVGQFLVKEGLHNKINEVYVSDSNRTVETWKHIAVQFKEADPDCLYDTKVSVVKDLREGIPSIPDPPSSLKELTSNCVYLVDGDRMMESFEKYIHRQDADKEHDTSELYICHPNLISYFVMKALQFPQTWSRLFVSPCGITHLKIADNGYVTLGSFNNGGFFEKDQNCLD